MPRRLRRSTGRPCSIAGICAICHIPCGSGRRRSRARCRERRGSLARQWSRGSSTSRIFILGGTTCQSRTRRCAICASVSTLSFSSSPAISRIEAGETSSSRLGTCSTLSSFLCSRFRETTTSRTHSRRDSGRRLRSGSAFSAPRSPSTRPTSSRSWASTPFAPGVHQQGALETSQLARATSKLERAHEGALRVAVLHHHLAAPPWRAARKRPLRDRDEVLRSLAVAGVELVLGGPRAPGRDRRAPGVRGSRRRMGSFTRACDSTGVQPGATRSQR